MIDRTLYLDTPKLGAATTMAGAGYVDGSLTREEILNSTKVSDDYRAWRVRRSHDNGRTWSSPEELPGVVVEDERGGLVTFPGGPIFDQANSSLMRVVMKRIWPGTPAYTFEWTTHLHPFHDHVFIAEEGSDPVCLRYEEGPDFDPNNPFDPVFARTNRAYHGQTVRSQPDGTALHPMVCYPRDIERPHRMGGCVLMRREPGSHEWQPSNQAYVSPEISSRGMLEPDAAVLGDGRILIVCRGSDTPQTAGRKWMTWSDDGGRTLAPIKEFAYADGTRFFSPSSFHRFVRSSRTGVLHWIGNICPEPPDGNQPRFPLVIGVVNEEKMALEPDSLVTIDDRQSGEPESIYFSNFYIIENRETLDLEIYMTRGAAWSETKWRHSIYRYVFKP